jgi:hypothetical protein
MDLRVSGLSRNIGLGIIDAGPLQRPLQPSQQSPRLNKLFIAVDISTEVL